MPRTPEGMTRSEQEPLMIQIPTAFFTVTELSIKWRLTTSDLAGLAIEGKISIVTGIGPTETDKGCLHGLVELYTPELLSMFRTDKSGPTRMSVTTIRPLQSSEWHQIIGGKQSLKVYFKDFMVDGNQVRSLEGKQGTHTPAPTRNPGGRPTGYDWDSFWRAMAVHVHKEGAPATLREFTDVGANWFEGQGSAVPSDSVIRKRLSPLWHQLRE